MSQSRNIEDLLRRGDQLLHDGDTSGAVEQYLLYCANLESLEPGGGTYERTLRLCSVRRRVLELDSERSDVRRALAEDYVALGLLTDAFYELERVAELRAADGDASGADDALKRLKELRK